MKMKYVPCSRCSGTGQQLDNTAIGYQFRRERIKALVSLTALADKLGITPPYLSDLELGRRAWTLEKLAKFREILRGMGGRR